MDPAEIKALLTKYPDLNPEDLTYNRTLTAPHTIYQKYRAYKDPHEAASNVARKYKVRASGGFQRRDDSTDLVGRVAQKWYTHDDHRDLRGLAATAATLFQT
jgi:hypothetical protein